MSNEEKETQKRSYKTLSKLEWAECGALWETGEFTLNSLSDRFGISPQNISIGLKKRGFEKGAASKDATEIAKREVRERVMTAASIAERLTRTREDHYNTMEAIAKATKSELVTAAKNGKSVSSVIENLKSLNVAADVLSKTFQQRLSALGIKEGEYDGDEEMPQLVISEMTADEIMQIREQSEKRTLEAIGSDVEDV